MNVMIFEKLFFFSDCVVCIFKMPESVLKEVARGWKTLLGTILVYVMGYPGTILIVVPSLINLQTNGTLTEGKSTFKCQLSTFKCNC